MIFSEETRVNNLKKMSEKELDILVIGGGITEPGIVLDGVTRGLDMGMVEMRDFGSRNVKSFDETSTRWLTLFTTV